LLGAFLFPKIAQSASFGTITITVTCRYLSISISPGTYAFGIVNPSSINVSQGSNTVKNTGNAPETFAIKGANTANWTLQNNPGTDQFELRAIFNSTMPASGDFGEEDRLTTSSQPSTDTRFAGNETGVSVENGSERHLWFRFSAPTGLSGPHPQQSIEVTVTAQAP